MTQAKHTPGPWEVFDNPQSNYGFEVIAPGATKSRRVVARFSGPDKLGNARLIAAAPDLLAACNEFVRKVDAGEARSTRSYEQMKVAIAKATGAA